MASPSSSSSYLLAVCLCFMGLSVLSTMVVAPKRPVNVPFHKNYVSTWAYDHIKYFNAGSEIQLYLDKYTGTNTYY